MIAVFAAFVVSCTTILSVLAFVTSMITGKYDRVNDVVIENLSTPAVAAFNELTAALNNPALVPVLNI